MRVASWNLLHGPGVGPDPGGHAYGIGALSMYRRLAVERLPLPGGGVGERRPEDVGRGLPGP